MRSKLNLIVCSALVAIAAAAAAGAAPALNVWTVEAMPHPPGGFCEDTVVSGPGYEVYVEQCGMLLDIDPSLGTGPTPVFCRRERCLSGDCPPFTTLHSRSRAGDTAGCRRLIEDPHRVLLRGWVAGQDLYVLRVFDEPAEPAADPR